MHSLSTELVRQVAPELVLPQVLYMPGAMAPGQGLTVQLALVLNSHPPSCLRPLSAGITDVDCHAQCKLE